ncbi:hypothetical protein Ciccas_012210 [Cichlidogyrus casuarinus]|uniref:Uncharacterized protein n=1 Tax=Cichlidogyrus casuarinus TaxID=1844966 RepID=A0ABD2PQF3_9PLAT
MSSRSAKDVPDSSNSAAASTKLCFKSSRGFLPFQLLEIHQETRRGFTLLSPESVLERLLSRENQRIRRRQNRQESSSLMSRRTQTADDPQSMQDIRSEEVFSE